MIQTIGEETLLDTTQSYRMPVCKDFRSLPSGQCQLKRGDG